MRTALWRLILNGYSRHATPDELLASISTAQVTELIAVLQITNAHQMPAWQANAIGMHNYWASRQFSKLPIEFFLPAFEKKEEKPQTPADHEAILRANLALYTKKKKPKTAT